MGNIPCFVGIDPGYKTGAVALVTSKWAEVHDLPVWDAGGVNTFALAQILQSVTVDKVIIEKQSARPMQGVASSFKLGMGYGQIIGALTLLQYKFQEITPAKWKKTLAVPADKDAARRIAQRTFPKLSNELSLKKHEHRAEALLMGEYGRLSYVG
jgi:hypothetical protein